MPSQLPFRVSCFVDGQSLARNASCAGYPLYPGAAHREKSVPRAPPFDAPVSMLNPVYSVCEKSVSALASLYLLNPLNKLFRVKKAQMPPLPLPHV